MKQQKLQRGFTIIEVLIVLAIAGLIITIVIVAIPQLQRNQRNTAREADAQRVGASAQNIISRNNGAVISTTNETALQNDIGKLNQYEVATVKIATDTTNPADSVINLDNIYIRPKSKCGTDGAVVAGTTRQFTVQFKVETNGGSQLRCLEY